MPFADPDKQRAASRESSARWRARKREQQQAEVAAVVDAWGLEDDARLPRELLLQILLVRARQGSMAAARLLLEELRRDKQAVAA
jgi:hypothetical protein